MMVASHTCSRCAYQIVVCLCVFAETLVGRISRAQTVEEIVPGFQLLHEQFRKGEIDASAVIEKVRAHHGLERQTVRHMLYAMGHSSKPESRKALLQLGQMECRLPPRERGPAVAKQQKGSCFHTSTVFEDLCALVTTRDGVLDAAVSGADEQCRLLYRNCALRNDRAAAKEDDLLKAIRQDQIGYARHVIINSLLPEVATKKSVPYLLRNYCDEIDGAGVQRILQRLEVPFDKWSCLEKRKTERGMPSR